MSTIISNSENDTKAIAKKLASKLNKGDVIVLSGDLGSGKTKFTEGFLAFWNLENEISSPTFTIVNEYNTPEFNINHFDVYRLSDIDEFYAMGGMEYFESGISIIEWGEMIEDILPPHIKIVFEKDEKNENKRILKIEANNNRLQNIIKELNEQC